MSLNNVHIPSNSHHKSFDELTSINTTRNQLESSYHWPKVIPKSPSAYSTRSLRLVPPPVSFDTKNYSVIDEFDLDKIEYERRKSHSNLFNNTAKDSLAENGEPQNNRQKDYGTAV